MLGFFIRLAVSVVTLFLVAHFSGGTVVVNNVTSAVIAAVVIGFSNAFIKPVLYWIGSQVTCVLTCLTLGLWSLILSWGISGLIFYLAGQWLPGFNVSTFWAALWGALALAVVNAIASVLTRGNSD